MKNNYKKIISFLLLSFLSSCGLFEDKKDETKNNSYKQQSNETSSKKML